MQLLTGIVTLFLNNIAQKCKRSFWGLSTGTNNLILFIIPRRWNIAMYSIALNDPQIHL